MTRWLEGHGAEVTVAAVIAVLAVDPDVSVRVITDLVADAHELHGLDPLWLGMLALAAPEIAAVPRAHATAAHATLLAASARLEATAIWQVEDAGEVGLTAMAGEIGPHEARMRDGALAVLRGERCDTAVPITAFGTPCAALTWAGSEDVAGLARPLAERSAMQLGLVFERAALLDGAVAQHAAAASGAERRLSRVAFDLHDGPMQDLALLCAELHRVRDALGDPPGACCTASRDRTDPRPLLDDVLAIAEATTTELRELAGTLESSALLRRPFAEALQALTRGFALRTGVEPVLHLHGDPATLSDAERVTVLRVIGEALANAREHSFARAVTVSVTVTAASIDAFVRDDGVGFDVAHMLPDAASRGRLGLVGMIERIRMMEGHCDILSRPGVGTTVQLALARAARLPLPALIEVAPEAAVRRPAAA